MRLLCDSGAHEDVDCGLSQTTKGCFGFDSSGGGQPGFGKAARGFEGRPTDFRVWKWRFVTDLGKGAADKIGRRFRCLSLNDNISWLTALGNDYAYEDVFVRQLMNYGKRGDLVLVMSVSGNSPNVVKALEWSKQNGLATVGLVGAKRGRVAELADQVIVIDSTHFGRVEDAHMGICHMLCYAFMENSEIGKV